ncbi:hypothetical protein FC41_GL000394 [Lactobacillus hominis DSM 23910 = CRBIP 24.179]|uniref:Uncharacterized protein n=1 Tax=Lactobacillus hominis DSM 23910 = CRBIP 24.179 TaxID=1423758 RepID=I7IW95_9LACO|nr:hypothetical protein FC41_GL000394 [Lactobacillus hominis DSM 23910 = CRBIP 24.179]CCI82698.1 Protein of unknown function [Lactobacillus hominis DSM 23910 = CRBIP 24.179]
MKTIKDKYFEGERILYGLKDASLDGITFGHGESPLRKLQILKLRIQFLTGNILSGMTKM